MSRKRQIDSDAIAQEFSAVAAFANSRPAAPKEQASEESQADQPTSGQTRKPASGQTGKQTSGQAGKTIVKYSSYLAPESVKRLKLLAVEEGTKDYVLLEEAVQLLFKSRRKQ